MKLSFIVVFVMFFSQSAVPETANMENEEYRIWTTGAPCTTRTDIEELGRGSPYQCMVAAYGLDETVKFGPHWHWKNTGE